MSHVGRETKFTALGQDWIAQRWERGSCHEKFIEWARSRLPDPCDTAIADVERLVLRAAEIQADPNMPPAKKQILLAGNLQQQEFVAQYSQDLKNEFLSIDSPRVAKVMGTYDGSLKMLQLMLEKHHPDVSVETCLAILEELGQRGMAELFNKTNGQMPPKAGSPEAESSSPGESPAPIETSTKNSPPATECAPPTLTD